MVPGGDVLTKKNVLRYAEILMLVALILNALAWVLVFTTDLDFADFSPEAYGILFASVFIYFTARYWCHENPFLK